MISSNFPACTVMSMPIATKACTGALFAELPNKPAVLLS
jgi:hypothetical protein